MTGMTDPTEINSVYWAHYTKKSIEIIIKACRLFSKAMNEFDKSTPSSFKDSCIYSTADYW